jgi:hypothetical protein
MLERYSTHLAVDKGHGGWGVAQGQTFDHLCEFGVQSAPMAPVAPAATGQPR